MNENDVPRSGGKALFIQSHIQFALQDADNFIFHMPVIIHNISGVDAVYMVEFKGKVGCAVLFCLIEV